MEDITTLAIQPDHASIIQKDWPVNGYGPLFIRLAWHCSGSYRVGDGRGGCDGGRIRFAPERDWPDNGNLDKARKLLEPVKAKHPDISWADLMTLAGTTAIKVMGGPMFGFCGGRTDDADGSASLPLGPTEEQRKIAACEVDGQCAVSGNGGIVGAVKLGLIYVNPEGVTKVVNGTKTIVPDPKLEVADVRETFKRMGMDDRETVALTAGGHCFGKTHGDSTGTMTSGFEGPWTHNPTTWDNDYFGLIHENTWEVHSNDKNQDATKRQWRSTDEKNTGLMMLTADLALGPLGGDIEYKKISAEFKDDFEGFGEEFSRAWYKLLSRDMGPHARCKGDLVPAPQAFQLSLPSPTPEQKSLDLAVVAKDVSDAIKTIDYSRVLIDMAWSCASTFRVHDHKGGCNGAFIRQAPQKEWFDNQTQSSHEEALALLTPIKDKHGDKLAWSELIVLAAQVAIEEWSGAKLAYCPGRTDAPTVAVDSEIAQVLDHLKHREFPDDRLTEIEELRARLAMSKQELMLLLARPHNLKATQPISKILSDIKNTNERDSIPLIKAAKDNYGTVIDALIAMTDAELADGFANAWTKLVNADRFEVDCSQNSESFATTSAPNTISSTKASNSTGTNGPKTNVTEDPENTSGAVTGMALSLAVPLFALVVAA